MPLAQPRANYGGRLYHFCCKGAEPEPGHCMDHFICFTNILVQLAFIYGSWCFFSWQSEDTVKIGDSIFLLGSLFTFVTCVHSMRESKFRVKQFITMALVTNSEAEGERDEACENCMFVLAAVFFAGGGMCYWPGITDGMSGEEAERTYQVGAYCFCTGSLGFLLAAYYNATGMAACAGRVPMSPKDWNIHYIKQTALLFSILGSVAFLMGSYLYRPGLSNNTCDRGSNFGFCVDVADSGTNLYVVGSCMYFLDASLAYLVTWINILFPDEAPESDYGEDYDE